jgi:hypothetical protein
LVFPHNNRERFTRHAIILRHDALFCNKPLVTPFGIVYFHNTQLSVIGDTYEAIN